MALSEQKGGTGMPQVTVATLNLFNRMGEW